MYNWNMKNEDGEVVQGYFSIEQKTAMLPAELREYYRTTHIDTVIIEGNEIHGYFDYSYLDEKTYNKQPQRAIGGKLDLSTNTSFLTAHLLMKFKYFHIEDYRKVMRLIQSKDEVSVTCYDIVADRLVTRNMYFKPPKMPLIHQMNLQVLGVRDMELELVGTNTDVQTSSVTYDYNIPTGAKLLEVIEEEEVKTTVEPITSTQEFVQNSSDIVGYNATIKNSQGSLILLSHATLIDNNNVKYKFVDWKDSANFHYLDNHAYIFNNPAVLTAQWSHETDTNNYLSSLTVNNYTISPNFDKNILTYAITIPNSVSAITVNATAEKTTSSVKILNATGLVQGLNFVKIEVTAESKDVRIYTIVVNKEL